MPTPRASDGEKGGPNQRGSSGDLMLPSAVAQLLPTPTTSDTNGPGAQGDGGSDLRTAVTLLPTPAVNDMGAAYTPEEWDAWTDRMKAEHGNGNGHGKSLSIEAQRLLPTPTSADSKASGGSTPSDVTLTDAVVRTDMGTRPNERLFPTPLVGSTSPAAHGQISGDFRAKMADAIDNWGDYAPAIHRWEQILGRPAPAPTMTSAKGNPQLSPRFVEWMMGLPEGWVDDVPDLTRNEKLKALGNGVVSQQAAEAVLRLLALGNEAAA